MVMLLMTVASSSPADGQPPPSPSVSGSPQPIVGILDHLRNGLAEVSTPSPAPIGYISPNPLSGSLGDRLKEYFALSRRIRATQEQVLALRRNGKLAEAHETEGDLGRDQRMSVDTQRLIRNEFLEADRAMGHHLAPAGPRGMAAWCAWRRTRSRVWLFNPEVWEPGAEVPINRPLALSMIAPATSIPFPSTCPESGLIQVTVGRLGKLGYSATAVECSVHQAIGRSDHLRRKRSQKLERELILR